MYQLNLDKNTQYRINTYSSSLTETTHERQVLLVRHESNFIKDQTNYVQKA